MKKLLITLLTIVSTSHGAYLSQAEIDIVTATIILEAGGEYDPHSLEAVNEVIHNRAIKRKLSPSEVCLQYRQFSCWNDKAAFKYNMKKAQRHPRWGEAKLIVMSSPTNHTLGADHYHADYVNPSWTKSMTKTVKIGKHIFYK